MATEPPYFDVHEASRVYIMNGRESAFYLLGLRSQYIENIPRDLVVSSPEVPVTRIIARVSADHLAAIGATLLRTGCRVELYSTNADDTYTLNID